MTIRKNFLFDDEIVEHLKAIAERDGMNQTEVVRNLIEEKYQEIAKNEKLAAFQRLMKSVKENGPNPFLEQFNKNDHKILQKVKAMMDV